MAVFIFIFSKLHHLSPDIKTNVPTQCLGWYQSDKVERGVKRNLVFVRSWIHPHPDPGSDFHPDSDSWPERGKEVSEEIWEMLSLVFVGSLLDFTNCPTSRLTRFSRLWKSSQKPDPEYWDPKNLTQNTETQKTWPRILRPKKGKLRPAPQYWDQIACPRREYCNPKTCPRILRSKIETKKAPKILRPKKGRQISRPNSI